MKQERFLPDQEQGIRKDFERSLVLETAAQATEAYRIISERMKSINEWDKYTGILSAKFTLTDLEGKEIHRMAIPGDYVKIDVPGPSLSLTKYDWVQVRSIKESEDGQKDENAFSMELHPSPAPGSDGKDIAHFFDDTSSSSFVLMRQHRKLTLSYHGRNEVPNIGISRVRDKLRNLLMGIGAALGMSDMQWKQLIKGLLDADT